jgi:hypothetical protein
MSNPEIPDADCGEYMARLEWRFSGEGGTDRPRRPSRGKAALPTCLCGGRGHVVHSADWRNNIDIEMRQVTRVRECEQCERRWHTVELDWSELQRLRSLAYSWLTHGNRDDMARRQNPDGARQ